MPAPNDKEASFCFSTYTGNVSGWFLDLGATKHLANEHEKLKNLRRLENPIRIKVAKSNVFLLAKQCGDLNISSFVNGIENKVEVKNVLLVPGLDHNLLPARKLKQNSYRIVLEKNKGIISINGKIVAIAEATESDMYLLNFHVNCALANVSTNVDMWHKQLGHLNYDTLKKLPEYVEDVKIVESSEKSKICSICIEGKQTKLPHDQHRTRAKGPLQLVHSDVMGPISPLSHDGKRYVVTFICDFTHFTAVYLIEYKSDVFHCFKEVLPVRR